ncbi:hypothetical protein C8J31_102901 [Rhizobium sp. PP-CC-2G-626]|nr:hypothetical protein C8J31_102901 [Rhizobium sp. PP-CC-2G-626]
MIGSTTNSYSSARWAGLAVADATHAAVTSPRARSSEAEVSKQPAGPVLPTQTTAQSARAKLDADYAKAVTQGTKIVADTAQGGRHLDVSSLSDDELATVSKGGGFSDDESLTAKAELAGRMWATLAPFEGNPRATSMAVRALYPVLGANVREALGWTEETLSSADSVIRNFSGSDQNHENDSVLEKLRKTQLSSNVLKFDSSLLTSKGGTVDILA